MSAPVFPFARRARTAVAGCAGLLAAWLVAGCSRSEAHADPHDHTTPAAMYKAGRGVQFSAVAAQAIELQAVDVPLRTVGEGEPVAAIPAGALLRTVKGDFVYVANGGWYLRTPVTVGRSADGWYEIAEGLYEGDAVIAHGTRAVWLAELQAVNGGVGCADDN